MRVSEILRADIDSARGHPRISVDGPRGGAVDIGRPGRASVFHPTCAGPSLTRCRRPLDFDGKLREASRGLVSAPDGLIVGHQSKPTVFVVHDRKTCFDGVFVPQG